MKTTGNTILVTGGTSGIGRSLAEAFHDRGNRVIVAGRRRDALDAMIAERPDLTGIEVDVTDGAALARAADKVRDRHPELNVILANAGISRPEAVVGARWDGADAAAIVQTNILGVIRTAAAFLPVVMGNEGATLMATGSALAFVPRADFPTYCASKAFLHSWLTSMRHQLRDVPVEVLELSPPYVQTGLTGADQVSDPRAMPLDDYVAEVMRLLESGAHPNGEVLLDRDLPRRWAERDGRYDTVFKAMNP